MFSRATIFAAIAATGLGASLGGCAQQPLSPDFGVALRQDLAAQVADPDKSYPQTVVPSDGVRAALAYGRYQKGRVTPPTGTASTVGAPTAIAPTLPQ